MKYQWVLFTVLAVATGCQTLSDKPESVRFMDCYRTIDAPEAHDFVQRALEMLERDYGGVKHPIDVVHLRRSKRNATGRMYRLAEGFSKTEWGAPGVVVIYIGVSPGHKEFYPLLGHECGHLLDPFIVDDWDMEGFCMVFSEQICRRTGRSWKVWERRFSKSSSDPYAKAYWKAKMAGDKASLTGEEAVRASEIRIDYVQHALSVFLGWERETLRHQSLE